MLVLFGLAALIARLLRGKGEFGDMFVFIGIPCAAILLMLLEYSALGKLLGW